MATYSTSYLQRSIADDAAFRARGVWISDAITAGGSGWALVTGGTISNIDWSTVTRATDPATPQGYEIRVSQDAAGDDIYLKLEYGSGASTSTFAMWITVGTGQDDAGGLTGHVTTRTYLQSLGDSADSTDYVSVDTGRLCVAMGVPQAAMATTGFGFAVERTVDATGTETDEGVSLMSWYYNNASRQQFIEFGVGVTAQATGLDTVGFSNASLGTADAIPYFAVYTEKTAQLQQVRDLVGIPTAWAGYGSTHELSHYGSTRTYLAVYGATASSSVWTAAPGRQLSICMRYD